MRKVIQQLGIYKKDTYRCIGLTALEVIMEILLPFVTARIVDEGLEAANISAVYRYGAIMVVLVAYCLRSVDLSAPPYGAATWVSLLVTVGLHVWRRNTVLSVVAGTVCYMVLIRTVFPL